MTELEIAQNELATLNEIIRCIPGKARFDDVLKPIIDNMVTYMGVDRISIALINKATKALDAFWISGCNTDEIRAQGKGIIRMEEKNDIAVMCINERQAKICFDADTDPRTQNKVIKISGVKSFAILPLNLADEPIGFIGFNNYDPQKKINLEDIAKYQRFVDTVALFFHNSRLYDELEEWNSTLESRVEVKTQELQEAHDRIFSYKENLSIIIDTTPAGIIATDPDGKVTVFNRAAREIFKGSMGQIHQGHIQSLFQPKDWEQISPILAGAADHKEQHLARNLEREMVGVDSSFIVVKLTISPLHHRSGALFGFIFTIYDLREIRFLENQLIHAEKLRMVGQMAAGISHEINTPLAMIKGSLSHLRTLLPTQDESINKHLGFMEEAVERGIHFMKDILQLSKPSPARFTKISVSELLLKAIEMYQLKNPAAKALIETHFQESLSFMYGDLHKLHQVLYNLLENAFFASGNSKKITVKAFMETVQISDLVSERETKRTSDPPHSRFFHLRRSAFLIQKKLSSLSKDGDTMVILEITDSGTGIPEEILGKIFDPFFTTKLQKGTGLGLAIVQSIIKRHHGAIDVVSEPGKGTTLFLKFPVYEDVIRFERML